MERTQLWPKKMTYLATLDMDPDKVSSDALDPKIEDARFSRASGVREGKPVRSEIYNALGESRVLGQETLTGRVVAYQEVLKVREEFEISDLEGRWILETPDKISLWCHYKGVLRGGARWPGVLRGRRAEFERPAAGSLRQSLALTAAVPVSAFISARFEVSHPKYQWLVERQCAGYGLFHLWEGRPVSLTFDLYALT